MKNVQKTNSEINMPISTETTRRMRALIDALKDISKQADEIQIRNADMATEISKLR